MLNSIAFLADYTPDKFRHLMMDLDIEASPGLKIYMADVIVLLLLVYGFAKEISYIRVACIYD